MSLYRIKAQQQQQQQLAVVAVSFICCFLLGSASACDYQRVDPSHTMCVYTPRSCGGKTLIRESIYFIYFIFLNQNQNQNPVCCWVGFYLFLGIRQHINHVAYSYARKIINFAIIIIFFF